MVSVKSRRVTSLLADYYTLFYNRVNTFRYSILLYKTMLPGKSIKFVRLFFPRGNYSAMPSCYAFKAVFHYSLCGYYMI
jgi:hypothetical protein